MTQFSKGWENEFLRDSLEARFDKEFIFISEQALWVCRFGRQRDFVASAFKHWDFRRIGQGIEMDHCVRPHDTVRYNASTGLKYDDAFL